MIKDNYIRKVSKVERVIDGDTIIVWLDKGDYESKRYIIRFVGVDTPERGRIGYSEATRFVEEAIKDQVVHIQTIKGKEIFDSSGFSTGGFGRYLGIVWVGEGEDQYNLNDRLLELGLAVIYEK